MGDYMTPEQLKRSADFYGIDMEEARQRYAILRAHDDDPMDPICVGCARRPPEIQDYRIAAMQHEDDDPSEQDVRNYVIDDEGTYNEQNGHFLCDDCYIKNGQPSKPFPDRWICP